MAGREERLPPATRNYVMFGVLLVVALGLALCEQFGPHQGRGETDSALRLLLVGTSPNLATSLDEVDGFAVTQISPQEALRHGRELVDEDEPAYLAVIAHADQLGYGFVVLGLEPPDDNPLFDWELGEGAPGIDNHPPEGIPYVVFSVGDLAPEGPRASWVELAPVHYEGVVGEGDSARLGLYNHPDLQALWLEDGTAHELQARQVLNNRGLLERRTSIKEDQAKWRELDALWPAPGAVSHSLAANWEQARGAPIHGGVLLEVRPAHAQVSKYRRLSLRLSELSELYFVSLAALENRSADEPPARQRCAGLPESFDGEIVLAPDGASIALRDLNENLASVYTFDPSAAAEGRCEAKHVADANGYRDPLGRPNTRARIAWTDHDFLTWHVGPGPTRYSPHVSGLGAYSGPWWVDGRLLAMIAERERRGPDDYGIEPVLTLFDTERPIDSAGVPLEHEWIQTSIAADELFAELGLEPGGASAALLDLRPTGPDELLLLTERCEDDATLDLRPCLHRLRSHASLLELTTTRAAADRALALAQDQADVPVEPEARTSPPPKPPDFELEQIGAIGPYLSLAIAAEGGRAAWIAWVGAANEERQLVTADLRGPTPLEPVRLDDDELADRIPRISADGRIVLSSVIVELGELGEVSVVRAFVLPPPPTDPAPAPAPVDEPAPEPEPATSNTP